MEREMALNLITLLMSNLAAGTKERDYLHQQGRSSVSVISLASTDSFKASFITLNPRLVWSTCRNGRTSNPLNCSLSWSVNLDQGVDASISYRDSSPI